MAWNSTLVITNTAEESYLNHLKFVFTNYIPTAITV